MKLIRKFPSASFSSNTKLRILSIEEINALTNLRLLCCYMLCLSFGFTLHLNDSSPQLSSLLF